MTLLLAHVFGIQNRSAKRIVFLQKLNPTHKIHGFFISISWPPPCVCATPLLSTDSFFVHFESFVEHSKAKGTCGHSDVPKTRNFMFDFGMVGLEMLVCGITIRSAKYIVFCYPSEIRSIKYMVFVSSQSDPQNTLFFVIEVKSDP